MLSRLTNTVEISHKWVLINFKYQEPSFYDRLFDNYEEGPFDVPSGHMKVVVIRKSVPGSPKFYVWHEINITCVFLSFFV